MYGVEEAGDVANTALEWTIRHAKRYIRNAAIRGFVTFQVERRATLDPVIVDDIDVAAILQTTFDLDSRTLDGEEFNDFCSSNSESIAPYR